MDLYRVYLDNTKMISKQVTVDVDGVISSELVSIEVPDPTTVGYYVVESESVLKNDIFKNFADFKFEKLGVAYGDVSLLQSSVNNVSAQQMVETLKSKLDETTFRNVLNFVFGKPLIEPPIVDVPSVDVVPDANSGTGVALPLETPDITNAIKEHFTKDIPKLEELIAQKQKELSVEPTPIIPVPVDIETINPIIPLPTFSRNVEPNIVTVAETPTGIVSTPPVFTPEQIPALAPEIIQQLKDEQVKKQDIADRQIKDQLALIEFRNILLPLLDAELQKFLQRDNELEALALLKAQALMPQEIAPVLPETRPQSEKIVEDGSVVKPETMPTKLFKTADSAIPPSPVDGLLTMPTSYVAQKNISFKEDPTTKFLGSPITEVPSKTEIVLPPTDQLPEKNPTEQTSGIIPNFGSSILS